MTTDTRHLDPALVEVAARKTKCRECGANPSYPCVHAGQRDTRDGAGRTHPVRRADAMETIRAVLPSLRAQVAAEVLGPVLALADDWVGESRPACYDAQAQRAEMIDRLRALVTDPDAVTRHEAGDEAGDEPIRVPVDDFVQRAIARTDEVTR